MAPFRVSSFVLEFPPLSFAVPLAMCLMNVPSVFLASKKNKWQSATIVNVFKFIYFCTGTGHERNSSN